MHRSIHRSAHECLWVIGLEEIRRVYLLVFGVLEVKYNLDRTGMKKKIKTAKTACIGIWPPVHFLYLQGLYIFWTAGITTDGDSSGFHAGNFIS